jgi:protein-S-isoprenylcysteine O-methyltransferase Ste14
MVAGLTGIALLLGSVTPFLVVPAFAVLIDRRFIRREEAILERTFGVQYAEYTRTVRRWL